MPTKPKLADKPLGPDGQPIVVQGARGTVSVEQVGSHPVIYTGETDANGTPVDDISAALHRLISEPLRDENRPRIVAAGLFPVPLDKAYGDRSEAREIAAVEREIEDGIEQDAHTAAAVGTLGKVAADVGKGVALEGSQAILTGAKRAVNETLDLVETAADALPGAAVVWGDTDFNPDTDNGIRFEVGTGAEMKAKTGVQKFLSGFSINPKDEPVTTTGKVIEGISQFATGMVGAGKLLKGWSAATRAGQVGKAMASGAISDFAAFDGHQERLSNLLAHVAPEQTKPIFEFLASDADDPEIVGRMKNAVEGLGLGAAADGFMGALKAVRAMRLVKAQARNAAKAEGLQIDPAASAADLKERATAAAKQIKAALGDETATGPIATLSRKIGKNEGVGGGSAQRAAKAVTSATVPPNAYDINFARIQTADDVKAVISTLVKRHVGDVEGARRGVRSWNETQLAAGKLDWVASMAQRRAGDAVNAETALAYREALNASATKLLDLAKAVQAEPSAGNEFAFRKMMAIHRAIQLEFMGARAESGRALNAFKIPAGTPERSLRNIDSLLADAGGTNASKELAARILDAAKRGDVALNTMVAQGAMARSRSLIRLVYVNSLLSGTGTPIINMVGNTSAVLMNVAARAVSPRLARALGSEPATEIGEAAALLHGYVGAIHDMFRLNPIEAAEQIGKDGAAALREQGIWRGMAPGIDAAAPAGITLRAEREEAGAALSQTMSERPLSAGAWGVSEDSTFGRILDVTQMVVESPSNFNATTDDFFKVLAARGELHAQAFRQATRELQAGMLEGQDALKARLQDIVDNPTREMLDAAEREMHELTFSRSDGKLAQRLSDLRKVLDSAGPVPIGSILAPFLRTPANLISHAMRFTPLAPFMKRFQKDLAEGGAKAEVAKAQMAIGTALWSLWLGMANDGTLTGRGPDNKAQRDALMRADEFGGVGWQPYSIRIDDRWISFERIDPPFGTSMSLVADLGELLRNDDFDGARIEDATELTGHIVASLGQAFFNRTSFLSTMEMTEAFTSGDASQAERAIMARVSGAVPASGLMRNLRRGQDPYIRATHDALTAIMNTLPMFSEHLPVQRDLWGRPRTYQTGLGTVYDAALPVQTKEAGASVIDLEMLRLGSAVAMPDRSITVDGVRVSLRNRPDIYGELVRRSGAPAFDQLEAVVTGGHEDSAFYDGLSDGPDGDKAAYIKDVVSAFRRDARQEILNLYGPELRAMAADAQRRRQKAGMEAE